MLSRREQDMTENKAAGNKVAGHDAGAGSHDQVACWRRDRLVDAGFSQGLAVELARTPAIDLHALLQLVDRGCPPELAARILAPLPGPDQAR